jgi:hypothetical protein
MEMYAPQKASSHQLLPSAYTQAPTGNATLPANEGKGMIVVNAKLQSEPIEIGGLFVLTVEHRVLCLIQVFVFLECASATQLGLQSVTIAPRVPKIWIVTTINSIVNKIKISIKFS